MEASLENMPKDVFIEIILKLPAPSIFNLCSTNRLFQDKCNKWADDIYRALIIRDRVPINNKLSLKDNYIKWFLDVGQPYYIKIEDDEAYAQLCQLRLGDFAEIKNRGRDRDLINYARVHIGENREDNHLNKPYTLAYYNRGTTYWVGGYISRHGSNLGIYSSKENAIHGAIFPRDETYTTEKLDNIFPQKHIRQSLVPNRVNDFYSRDADIHNLRTLRNHLKNDECIIYDDEGFIKVYLVKQISLA